MSRHRINHRRVRIHLFYTVDELARLLGVHKNTVRFWVKQGLRPIEDRRPYLFHGGTVQEFLANRKLKSKQTCQPGELYCVRCRKPHKPAFDVVEYIPLSTSGGNLRGLCPVCASLMHRRVSFAKLRAVTCGIEVKFQDGQRHITERSQPCVNRVFEKETAA